MSAVSKSVMPASSAAPTTASVSARPMRPPKLLQPSPTTLTVNAPIERVSTPCSLLRPAPVPPPCTLPTAPGRETGARGGIDGRGRGGRHRGGRTGGGLEASRRLCRRQGLLPGHRFVPHGGR